jgi:multidrug efflux system outer membrane protein
MRTQFFGKLFVQFLVLLLFINLSGCKMGPNYCPPENCVPEHWIIPEENVESQITYDLPPIFWWEIFNDPLLNRYIQIAANYNNDVLAAEANIFQARAVRKVTAAPLYPQLSADLDGYHTFISKNGPLFAAESGAVAPVATPTIPQHFNIFNNFLDASWELDIFGKTQRSIEASQAQLESTIEQRNDLLISVFGEITRNYIELRSAQKQKMLLERNVELLKNNVDLIQRRYSSGYSNLLDLEQINIQLNQAISVLPSVNTTIYQNVFAISVLIGELPETLLQELLPIKCLPELPCSLSVGLRSELMRRRPDIRRAERNLAQATANIGVAVASFYPSVTLTGFFGLDSLKLSNLYTPNSKMWIYGADISLPIFQGGKLIGNLQISEAQTAAFAYTYQQTVLNAFRDAEGALVSYTENVKTTADLNKIVSSNLKLTKLNELRYTKGLVSQLDFLSSELILNNSELSLLQAETAALLDLVSLYKALGGGWEPFGKCLSGSESL